MVLGDQSYHLLTYATAAEGESHLVDDAQVSLIQASQLVWVLSHDTNVVIEDAVCQAQSLCRVALLS